MKNPRSLVQLTDEQLLLAVKTLARGERDATAQLIASLAELDARDLYLAEGFPSLFAYCTQCLHLSEHAAYGRIAAARAARRWPVILDLLADGSTTLTTVCLLATHLTGDNHLSLLEAAKHRTRREVEAQVAALRPLPPVPSTIRKVPASRTIDQQPAVAIAQTPLTVVLETTASAPADADHAVAVGSPRRPAIVVPLAPEIYKVQITISRDTHDKLRRVQDLMRHSVPNGDPAQIFDRALTLLLADLRCRSHNQYEAGVRSRPSCLDQESETFDFTSG